MSGFRTAVTTALGLDEKATIADINAAWDKMLAEDMTEEEKAAMMQKKKDEVAKNGDSEATEGLKALRTVFKLDEKAGIKDVIAAATKAATAPVVPAAPVTDTALSLEVKSLGERLVIAEAGAKKAEELEKAAKVSSRDLFFSEQIRAGKMIPAEKDFFATSWEKDELAVRKYFETKKPVVKLGERGSDVPGLEFTDKDPREELKELADKRVVEKKVSFTEAVGQISKEQPELAERVAACYGPAGLARR